MFNRLGICSLFGYGIAGRTQDLMGNSAALDAVNDLSNDSLHGVGTFFQNQPVAIHPQLIHAAGDNWILYVLFALLLMIALIRFFYPVATRTIFLWFLGTGSRKSGDSYSKPGVLVPSFLLLNFIFSFTLFIVEVHSKTSTGFHNLSSPSLFWLYAAGGIVGFYLYNQIFAFLIGFIFNTDSEASIQMKSNTTWAYITGLFLTPFLLLYFYSKSDFIFYVIAGGLIILLFLKWFQTVKVGLSARSFNMLHLFLYLCAVEIIPLLLLVKVFVK